MKKQLLVLVLLIGFSLNATAYDVHESSGNDVAGSCNGSAFSGSKDSGDYWTISGPGGNHFSKSRSEAIRKACSKKSGNNKMLVVKKDAMVFEKKDGEKGIISSLTSEVNYNSTKATVSLSGKHGFIISKDANLKVLAYYKRHKTLSDKYGNWWASKSDAIKLGIEEGDLKSVTIIDDYYKITDSTGKKYYEIPRGQPA